MAYISQEDKKVIVNELKEMFPSKLGWKFSIGIRHYSSLQVYIMSAPIDFGVEHKDVNPYWVNDNYKDAEENILQALNQIIAICNRTNYDNSDSQTDYFDVGYYFHLAIGKYDKPFKYVPTSKNETPVRIGFSSKEENKPCGSN